MRFNLLHWKGLLFRLDKVKRGINLKMSNAPFRVSFVVLCSRIGTRSTRMREQKNDEKGYLFSSWAVRSAVII